MKIANCTKTFLLVFLNIFNIFSISRIYADSTITTDIPSEEALIIDNLLQLTYTLPVKLDQIAGRLALLVNKHQIRNLGNKDTIIEILRDIRTLMNSALSEQASITAINDPEVQAQIIHAVLQLCDALADHFENGMRKNLSDLKPFDLEQLTRRQVPVNITPDQLVQSFTQINKKVERVEKKADMVGLSWYNIATRRLEEYVVDPFKKYHIPTITKVLGLSGLVTNFIVWRYGEHFTESHKTTDSKIYNFLNAWTDTLHNSLGTPIPINEHGVRDYTAKIDGKVPYGLLGLIDAIITDTMKMTHPHSALLATTTIGAYLTAWRSATPWFEKQGSVVWNFLRGGAYEQKAIKGMWDFEPTVTFDNVIGMDEVKEELNFIIRFIENPEQYLRVYTSPEKGWLFTGPTRTGKSFMVEALCGEINRMLEKRGRTNELKYWKIPSEIFDQFSISDVLETAKDNAPIVLFIDEIDLLDLGRAGGNHKRLSQFLTSMSTTLDTDPRKQVILIAATNKPAQLDKALCQYGRFGKEIRFEYPSFEYRKIYLERELSNMALDISQFDLDALAHKTEGKHFEQLRAIIRTALIRAWTRGQQLSQALLEESLDTEIRHIIMADRKKLSESEKQILATHFAGKALAITLLDTHAQLDKVTIKAFMTDLKAETQWEEFMNKEEHEKQKEIKYGKIFTKNLHDTINLSTREQIINEIKVLLAGFAAEEILLGSCSYQCHSESSRYAYALNERLVFEGIPASKWEKKLYRQQAAKAYKLFTQYKQEIKELLTQHRDELNALAQKLTENDILTADQVQQVIDEVREVPEETSEPVAAQA